MNGKRRFSGTSLSFKDSEKATPSSCTILWIRSSAKRIQQKAYRIVRKP
jgi:hypothetical protein